MEKYVYALSAIIVGFLGLLFLELWGVINLSEDTWMKITGSAVLLGCIALVLIGVKHFKSERSDDRDNLISS